MADNDLPVLPSTATTITVDLINDGRQAQLGDIVPRNALGKPTNLAGSLGRPSLRFREVHGDEYFVGEQTLEAVIQATAGTGGGGSAGGSGIPLANRIRQGNPFFLRKGAGNLDLEIFASALEPLTGILGNTTFAFTAPITTTLSAVPTYTSTNSILVGTTDQQLYGPVSRSMGETPAGEMEINSSTGTTPEQESTAHGLVVGVDTEYFIGARENRDVGYVGTSNAQTFRDVFTNCTRGIARLTGTSPVTRLDLVTGTHVATRTAFAAVFLRPTIVTPASIVVSYRMPQFITTGIFPTTGSVNGDTLWDDLTESWFQFDGSVWSALDAVFCGFVIIDAGVIVGTAPVWPSDTVEALKAIIPVGGRRFSLTDVPVGETLIDDALYHGFSAIDQTRFLTTVAPYYVGTEDRVEGFMNVPDCLAQRFINVPGVDWFHPDGQSIYAGNIVIENATTTPLFRAYDFDIRNQLYEGGQNNGGSAGSTRVWNSAIRVFQISDTSTSPPLIYVGGVGGIMTKTDAFSGATVSSPDPDVDPGQYRFTR